MIPLRDTIRSNKLPYITWALIAANMLVFLYETTLDERSLDWLISNFGMVPALLRPENLLGLIPRPLALGSLFTSMFLHGGWFHLISNMWTLFIFGDNVEDRMGSTRFLLFYVLSGIAANLLQAIIFSHSRIPAIGASGAIAGVLGAYFLLFPFSKVVTLIPVFFVPWFVEIPSLFYLGFWFLSQLYSGIFSIGLPDKVNMGGIAWWAHIGGFLFGFLVVKIFVRRYSSDYSHYD